MKKSLLFPNWFKIVGVVKFFASFLLYMANNRYGFELPFLRMHTETTKSGISDVLLPHNYTLSLALIGMLAGLLLFAFSRQKIEDEMVQHIRLQSLQIAVYACFVLLIFLVLFTFSLDFLFYATILWYIFLIVYCIVFYVNVFRLNS